MSNMISIDAPAKLNLTLEVTDKRPDGYHEIRTVIQTINLCDRLIFHSGQQLTFTSNSEGWDAEKSLVSAAARLLQEKNGITKGATIEVEKHIPMVAGLGGDSSDAAATLQGLNQLWKLVLSREELHELASQLGSDVAFFLYGGTALAEGRGEVLTPLPPLSHQWVVLAMPDVPFLCHYRRAIELVDTWPYSEITEYLKSHRDKQKQAFTTLAHHDGMHFAPKIKARCLFSVALMDMVCPPSTVFAAYNRIKARKEIRIYDFNNHEGGGPFQTTERLRFAAKHL